MATPNVPSDISVLSFSPWTKTSLRGALGRAQSGPAAAPSAHGRGLSCHSPRERPVAWSRRTTRCRQRRPSFSQLQRRAGKGPPAGQAAAAERPGELRQSLGKPPARRRRKISPLLLPAAGCPGMDAGREVLRREPACSCGFCGTKGAGQRRRAAGRPPHCELAALLRDGCCLWLCQWVMVVCRWSIYRHLYDACSTLRSRPRL